MIDKFKAAFKEEAHELLSQLEDTLLELESHPRNGELINAAFRAIHTIKGSSAMFGFESISKFTHEVESALDQCRNGTLPVTKDFIGLTLKARDHLKDMLGQEEPPPQVVIEEGESLLVRYRDFLAGGKGSPVQKAEANVAGQAQASTTEASGLHEAAAQPEPQQTTPAERAVSDKPTTFRITFKPKPDILRDGTRVLNLVEEIAGLGQAAIYAHTEDIPAFESLDPEACYMYWDIVLTTTRTENDIRDVFIFVEDKSELKIEKIAGESLDEEGRAKRLGAILVERGLVSRADLRDALGSQRKLGEVLVEKKIVSKPEIDSALVEQEHLKKVQEKLDSSGASIRVASEKLDSLVDLVGELVTLQARLSQTSLDLKDAALSSICEQFERLISQLRDNTMSIRMLPIGSTFNKFRRVVRDLSIELGKEAELATEGAETELDKTVIEKLGDPLVHIIRNSLDHGIEKPEDREKGGKPRTGKIMLSARHSGAYVLIQVSDDGKGLDRDAIYAKAVERGVIAAGQEMSEQDLFMLIFAPGFSTAKTITSVSGRGVGMDVVKREIDSLGGIVSLSSERGKGLTVTLKIPLTLAIIEGLLVRTGEEYFVVPLSTVDGCIEIGREELAAYGEKRIISYRDDLVPFVALRSSFDVPGDPPAIEQMVIANLQDSRMGFVVDQVVGNYQTVIKPLGRMFRGVQGLSGATILGDGTVALILDVNALALVVQTESGRKAGRGSNH